MEESCRLENLTPELQLRMISWLAEPEDLRALIKASPRFFQVFLLNKQSILWAVAQREFHSAVLPDALKFAAVAQLEAPTEIDEILNLIEVEESASEGTGITLSEVVTLCSLAKILRFFINDYTRNTLPMMDALGISLDHKILPEYQPQSLEHHHELSDQENGRLQRAFCRFEIVRLIFAGWPGGSDLRRYLQGGDTGIIKERKVTSYLEQFPDYQIIEIGCIRDYVWRRLRGIFNEVEDAAFATLTVDDFVFEPGVDWECAISGDGNWLFSRFGKSEQDSHIETLLSYGLPYLRRLIEPSSDERISRFQQTMKSHRPYHRDMCGLTGALELLGKNPDGGQHYPSRDLVHFERDPKAPLDFPDVWRWVSPPRKLWERYNKGLRDWGYVFWDVGRLLASGILEHDGYALGKVSFDDGYSASGLSVEQRIRGMTDDDDTSLASDESYQYLEVSPPYVAPPKRRIYAYVEPGPSTLWGILDSNIVPYSELTRLDDEREFLPSMGDWYDDVNTSSSDPIVW